MITTSSEHIVGKEIKETLGMVVGSTVQSKHIGRDIMAGLKTLIGGELKGYTEMLEEARAVAISRMETEAGYKDADAIVAVRLTTSSIGQGISEIVAYGTAVKF